MLEIEKNVPIIAAGGGRPKKYPFTEMEVGDSFFVPTAKEDHAARRNCMSTARCRITKLTGYVFAIRTVDGGLRVWRTK